MAETDTNLLWRTHATSLLATVEIDKSSSRAAITVLVQYQSWQQTTTFFFKRRPVELDYSFFGRESTNSHTFSGLCTLNFLTLELAKSH